MTHSTDKSGEAANEKREEAGRFEVWMDATRAWWRKWSMEEPAACSAAQIGHLMREAFEAGFNTGQALAPSAVATTNARAAALECVRMVDEYNDQSEVGDVLTQLADNMRAYAATYERTTKAPACIAHAANAYPRLVDGEQAAMIALHAIATNLSWTANDMREMAQAEFDRRRALLRELGEE